MALAFAGLLLSGCASQDAKDVLLLKELRSTRPTQYEVTAVAPRSTEDIAGLLARYERPATLPWEAANAQLDQDVLETSVDASERYVTHGADPSARNGRYRQYLNNWHLAVKAAKGSRWEYFRVVDRAFALALAGPSGEAINARDSVISAAQGYGGSAFVGVAYLMLAARHAELGDFQTSRNYIDKALPLYRRARSTTSGTLWYGEMWDAETAFYSAVVLTFEGDYAAARQGFVLAMEALDRDIARSSKRTQSNIPGPAQSRLEAWRALIHAHLGEVLAKEGRFSAAELEIREGLVRSLRFSGDRTPVVAALLTRFSRVVYDQGRYAEARDLAHLAIVRFEQGGAAPSSPNYLAARRAAARAQAALGNWDQASIQLAAVTRAIALDSSLKDMTVAEDVDHGMILLRTGRPWLAYQGVHRHAGRINELLGSGHYDALEARCVAAMALKEMQKAAEAFVEFRQCIPGLRREALGREWLAPQRLRFNQIIESYIGLLYQLRNSSPLQEAKVDAAEESFLLSDLVRRGVVQKSLLNGVLRSTTTDQGLVRIMDHEHESSRAVFALEAQLVLQMGAPAEDRNRELEDVLRRQLETSRRVQSLARAELVKKLPRYSRLVEPAEADLGAVRGALRDDQVLVAMLTGEQQLFLWSFGRHGALEFRAVDKGAAELERRVQRIRLGLDLQTAPIEALPEFDLKAAHELFEAVLGPLEGWRKGRSLLFLPHGALKRLPIDLLPTDSVASALQDDRVLFDRFKRVPWLVRTHSVVQLPALDVLTMRIGFPEPARGRQKFAGIADPFFSVAQLPSQGSFSRDEAEDGATHAMLAATRNLTVARVTKVVGTLQESTVTRNSSGMEQVPPLPETRQEVMSIAQALGASEDDSLFMGSRASETVVKSGVLAERRVVVFATHGLVAGELDGLSQPALALSNPSVTKETGEDGLLTMSEVFGLQLKADMVILSACNTAAGENQGAEAVSGLVRAFLYAGARNALATHWAVESTSASLITTGLFKHMSAQAGTQTAEGLRRSMLDLIESPGYPAGHPKPMFSYAHPVFWSAFSLIGSGY